MDILEKIGEESIKKNVPSFKAGDTVKVHFTVIEAEKKRIQTFQGIVIQKRGSLINKTFTVRKISHGIAIERIFPLYSPLIEKIEIIRRGHVRRAKLFYIRKLRGKSTKVKKAKRLSVNKKKLEA